MVKTIKIDDLYRLYGGREFELFIKRRKEVVYKRTAQKGFLPEPVVISGLDTETIDILLKH